MSLSYQERKNDLVTCPYNKNHKVKRSHLIVHKKKCPDRNTKGLVKCPYNSSHEMKISMLESHKSKCPDRIIIKETTKNEMAECIKKMNSEKLNFEKMLSNTSKNLNKLKEEEIVGLGKQKRKNKINQKKIFIIKNQEENYYEDENFIYENNETESKEIRKEQGKINEENWINKNLNENKSETNIKRSLEEKNNKEEEEEKYTVIYNESNRDLANMPNSDIYNLWFLDTAVYEFTGDNSKSNSSFDSNSNKSKEKENNDFEEEEDIKEGKEKGDNQEESIRMEEEDSN